MENTGKTLKFKHRVRARWAECDPQGLVFNARYLDYFEIVQAEYFRELGINIYSPETWKTFAYVVRGAELEFRAPVQVDEEIDLCMGVTSMGRSSISVTMTVEHAATGETAFASTLLLVNFDSEAMASRPVPDWVRSKIEAHEGIG